MVEGVLQIVRSYVKKTAQQVSFAGPNTLNPKTIDSKAVSESERKMLGIEELLLLLVFSFRR